MLPESSAVPSSLSNLANGLVLDDELLLVEVDELAVSAEVLEEVLELVEVELEPSRLVSEL